MSKEPFEKIRSLVERRHIFEAMVEKRSEVLCKGKDDSLFYLIPRAIMGENLVVGAIKAIEKEPTGDVDVIGNFAVNEERYFFVGPMKVTAFEGILQANSDVYKLQRRQSHRVQIPEELKMNFNLTAVDNEKVFINGKFDDISIGGARIYFAPGEMAKALKGSIRLIQGTELQGYIHAPSGKSIEIEAQIKHVLKSSDGLEHYGLEFRTGKVVTKNRLISLVMDIQHRIITET